MIAFVKIKGRFAPIESETCAKPGPSSRAEAEEAVHTLIRWTGGDPRCEGLMATQSRVSYFMNKFQSLGLIDYNRALRVRKNLSKLGTD